MLVDRDVDAHRPLQLDAVIVDKPLGLVASVLPVRDGALHPRLRRFEQPVVAGADLCRAVLRHQRDQSLFAEPIGTELAADVAEHQFRRAAVGGDDALQIGVWNVSALVAHRRNLQAFVENLARLAGTASRHGTANVALMRDAAAEAEQAAVDEDRRDHGDVGRMGAAALVGMIDQKGVALRNGVAERAEHGGAAGRERPDMERQHHVLGDHLAPRVHQCTGCILGLAHDGGETGAKQRVLHFLDDSAEARLDDFEVDRVDGGRRGAVSYVVIRHGAPPVMIMFFHASTRAVWPRQTTVVASN